MCFKTMLITLVLKIVFHIFYSWLIIRNRVSPNWALSQQVGYKFLCNPSLTVQKVLDKT